MPKYLLTASYNRDGINGLLKEGGTGRKQALTRAIEGLNGKMEVFYFAFGDRDVYFIADFPDHVSAAALSLAAGAGGAVSEVGTTVLLTPEEMDQATKTGVSYRPPGG